MGKSGIIEMGRPANISIYNDDENAFWENLKGHQNSAFYTAHGLEFQYQIIGNEMFVTRKEKSITRSTVMLAYRRARKLHTVSGPKQLGVFGASYLYPVFLKLDICVSERREVAASRLPLLTP